MPRSPRLEYSDAIYHVTARGVQQDKIFLDDVDRISLLKILERALRIMEARAFAYCLMGNHYHFVLQTRHANLSELMHRINATYCMTFNRRHGRCGHLFEGRFKAVHVDRDAYLLEVCRYVDLNPVRAGMVDDPARWAWSSYRAHVDSAPPPPWLASAELHGVLTGCTSMASEQETGARRRYAEWVAAGRGVQLWKKSLREGLYLGNDAFVERLKKLAV